MNKKKFLAILVSFLIVTIRSYSASSHQALRVTSPANAWIGTYICSPDGSFLCDKNDLQVILNVMYLAYQRSYVTLCAQEKACASLDISWHVFQNILQTRRNPSKDISYSIDKEAFAIAMNNLFDMQEMHLHIGTTYSKALDAVMSGDLLSNKHLLDGIKELRNQARVAIVHSLTDVNEYINALLHTRNNNIDEQVKAIVNCVDEYSNGVRNNLLVADYLWSLVPYLAVNSFVKADNLTVTMSEQWWKALMQMISISNFIWRSVETARGNLYLEYYNALYAIALNNNCSDRLAILFDEKGLNYGATELRYLPEPQNLSPIVSEAKNY